MTLIHHDEPNQPYLLIVSHALSGHLSPMIRIAAGLRMRGWNQIGFLGPSAHRAGIEHAGAEFFQLTGEADLDDRAYYEQPPVSCYRDLDWVERVKVDLRLQCLQPIPTQWANLRGVLAVIHQKSPGQRVVVLAEAFFLGVLPLKYGAPLPEGIPAPKSLCISVTVPAIRSVDLPPVGYQLPFDQSVQGRARNAKMWDHWTNEGAELSDLLNRKLIEAGSTRETTEPFLAGSNYKCHDMILQLGVPGFEYSRSDWPLNFRFAGLVQGSKKGGSTAPSTSFSWWREVFKNSRMPKNDPLRKKLLVVAQGTVETNPRDLIIPTVEAFASRPDFLVIAILGWKDASLLINVPENTRVADFLSYDAILEHADVWVHNAGFGAINHGIANGVPMVVAGEGMDKTENARRVKWSGAGIDLATAKPSVDMVRQAVETILEDNTWKSRINELKKESEELHCFEIIHEEILKLDAA